MTALVLSIVLFAAVEIRTARAETSHESGPPPQGLGLVYLAPAELRLSDAGSLAMHMEDALVASAANRLSSTGWTLLTRATVQRLLADRGVDGLAAYASAQSELEFARFARVRFLVTTTVRPFDGTLIATQLLIDCNTGEPIASARIESGNRRELVTRLAPEIDRLLANLPNAAIKSVISTPTPDTIRDQPLHVGPRKAPRIAPLEPVQESEVQQVLVRLAGDLDSSDSFLNELRLRLEERGFALVESGKKTPWVVRITLQYSSSDGMTGSRLRPSFVQASYELDGRTKKSVARGRVEGRAAHVDSSVGRRRALEESARKLAMQLVVDLIDAEP